MGPLSVTLTDAGTADPLFAGVPGDFAAYGGHKEAMAGAAARAPCCWPSRRPARCRRSGSGSNVYATQFHPELDLAGICTRIDVYRHAGYFEPDQADVLKRAGRGGRGHPPAAPAPRNFVAAHAR